MHQGFRIILRVQLEYYCVLSLTNWQKLTFNAVKNCSSSVKTRYNIFASFMLD